MSPRSHPPSRRLRRAWWAVGGTLAGTVVLAAGGLWLQRARETDLQSTAGAVTNMAVLDIPADAPPIRFSEVAAAAGVRMQHGQGRRHHALPEDTGSGLAWLDLEADGDPDLFVVNMATPEEGAPADRAAAANALFVNQGGGRFLEGAAAAGLADGEGLGMGAAVADYDGDGDADLYVTKVGPNRLYRNRGDGTFEEVAETAGVADARWSTGATWADYDRDGHLDLYVANYVSFDPAVLEQASDLKTEFPFTLNPNSFPAQANALYRNRGDGSFEEVTAAAGVADPDGRGLNAVFCDLDRNGWPDLFVANDASPNRVYISRGPQPGGQVTFEDRTAGMGMADTRSGMGVTIADLAGEGGGPDGWPDLFIGNWVAQDNALYRAVAYADQLVEYHDDARAHGLAEVSTAEVSWGTVAADLDLDGRPELVVINGSTLQQPTDPLLLRPEKPFLFWSDGRRYINLAPAAGPAFTQAFDGRGLAAADFDADGDIDLAVSVNRGRPLLLRNDTETSHRGLAVQLDAPDALRLGARLRVTVAGQVQERWVGADASYLSTHALDLPFGLGRSAQADRVEVVWADGRRTERSAVPAGRLLLAPEP